MKKTYKLILETVNGQTREVVVVLKKSLIKKLPTRHCDGSVAPNYVKPKHKPKAPIA